MRLLHTSDWHLGRSLHGYGLLEKQASVLDHLVEVVRSEGVDLVVVAGDVYDRALPPVEAVTVLDEALDRLLETGAHVLMSAGNHDSAQRLGFGRRRSARAGLHLRTGVDDASEPLMLRDAHGEVACYAIGYLEPSLLAAELGVPRSHQGVLGSAVAAIRRDAARRGCSRVVLAAHAFVAGGEASASERDIAVGGVDRVAVPVFDGFSYTALGHLHRPQTVTDRVRYSGSPLPYSFSEHAQRKGSWLVDLDAQGSVSARFVDAPELVPMALLRGELATLLADPALEPAEGAFCQVVLTDPHRPVAPMERLRRRFARTLTLSFEPSGVPASPAAVRQRLGLSDHDLCVSFFDTVREHRLSADEARYVRHAVEAVRLAGQEGGQPTLTASAVGATVAVAREVGS